MRPAGSALTRSQSMPTGHSGACVGLTTVRITDTWQLNQDYAENAHHGVELNHMIAGEILDHRAGLLWVQARSQATDELRWDSALGAGTYGLPSGRRSIAGRLMGRDVHRLRLDTESPRVC